MDVRKFKVPAMAGMAVVVAIIAGMVVFGGGRKKPLPAIMAAPAESKNLFVEQVADNEDVGRIEPLAKPQTQAVVQDADSVVPLTKNESRTIEPVAVTPIAKNSEPAYSQNQKLQKKSGLSENVKSAEPTAAKAEETPKVQVTTAAEIAAVEAEKVQMPVMAPVAAVAVKNTSEPDFAGSKAMEDAAATAAVERKAEPAAKPALDDIKIVEDAPAAAVAEKSPQPAKAVAASDAIVSAQNTEPQIAAISTAAETKKNSPQAENMIEDSPEVVKTEARPKADWFAAPADASDGTSRLESNSFTLDGTPGGFITPKAYLINPGRDGQLFGLPAVGVRFTSLGTKDIESFAIGETFLGRIELSYALSRMGLGTLKDEFRKKNGVSVDREVYLHTFSLRGLAVKENEFGQWTPAVTAGVEFKYNDGIRGIDNKLGGALGDVGFARSNGVDYTLTASKTLDVWGRALTVSGGLRFSQAAQLGFLGFGDAYRLTFEGNASYALTDWLRIGYEFRQKENPYRNWSGVVGGEDNWQAITADIIITDNLTLQGAYGLFGNFANADADGTWSVMLNWQF